MNALIQELGGDLATALSGGPIFTPADEYVFAFALAIRIASAPRASAVSYDGAAQIACSAGAYHEALLAFERAEEARPCPERRKKIAELRRVLAPAPSAAPGVKPRVHGTRHRRRGKHE
jgi:hypothetical protein